MNWPPESSQQCHVDNAGVLTWVHLGDLHMTKAGEQNNLDLQAIVDEINAVFASTISFLYVPGDIADDGSEQAYAVVKRSLDRLEVPWCAIVGDHDVHEKSFKNFLNSMGKATYYAFTVDNVRFLALNAFDIPDPGSFAILEEQMQWIKEEFVAADSKRQTKVLLLHCYPSDLKQGGEELHGLLAQHSVLLVDMGHTHYNEISNDGSTIYTATRSTGQIEEGPVGFSVTNLDAGVLSWRFAELSKLPFVMITSPCDERLLLDVQNSSKDTKRIRVRAKVWSASAIQNVEADFGQHRQPMQRIEGSNVWETVMEVAEMATGIHPLGVHVLDSQGAVGEDRIRVVIGGSSKRVREALDQDNAFEAWPEHGLLGTQLGPNKHGRKW